MAEGLRAAIQLSYSSICLSNPNPRVGCVILAPDGREIGRGHTQQAGGPHAEVMALRDAAQRGESTQGATAYVTLEPCPMCAGAIVWSRLPRLVFGALDEKAGAVGSLYNIAEDGRLNHRVEVVSGVEADAAGDLLRQFFRSRRAPTAGDGAPPEGLPLP